MTEAEERKYVFYVSVLKEIEKEFKRNTSIDTIITNLEARIKEHKKQNK